MRVRWLVVILVVLSSAVQGRASDGQDTLRGLKAVDVLVFLDEDTKYAGLSKSSIQTQIELRLRQNGITVSDEPFPYLDSVVRLLPVPGLPSCINVVRLRLLQRATLSRDPSTETAAATWWADEGFGIGNCDKAAQTIRSIVDNQMDEFLNDYLTENPVSRGEKGGP